MTTEVSENERRYVVGMDLGTTNSAVCYVDMHRTPRQVEVLRIPQLTAPGQIEALEVLPSFHYEPAEGEFPREALRLPFDDQPREYVVGAFARDQGARVPGRVIASAKSWLCHPGVDRTSPLLPWQGAVDVQRLSPVDVSSRYLEHVRRAWDARFPEHPLAAQDFILTIPASFDEVARRLTIKAAARAGLNRVVLIEEPQAAFYAWIDRHRDDWESFVEPGHKILVCDIGGGTSDFTLIRVRGDESGRFKFHRVAVGEHLILGGDNLDLALAKHLEQRIAQSLSPRQWSALVQRCRQAKEVLLGENPPETYSLTIPGEGAKLIGGGIRVEVTRDEVEAVLLDGFFPAVDLDARPQTQRSGFQEFGLPYAPDPAVTRYLAAFLTAHRHVTVGDEPLPDDHDPARPDIVLFNGGMFAAAAVRDRIVSVLARWFGEGDWMPLVLENDQLHLAVARGAAYYGMVRRGEGVRIAAGLARTYYLGVAVDAGEDGSKAAADDSGDATAEGDAPSDTSREVPQEIAPTALCVVPAGIEPGHEVHLPERTFTLRLGEP
ncbi:MAG: Hsp70 family protein, partial [Planctomycetota bacterium]